ncbi:uncharacterized protein LOC119727771 [Patiria miniata]|uniref:3'-5' exonuclease domain-containing protein n=1 Tax=Patiria miniata TaxID=46514 RepID=A0A913ZW55_PATMI|nr:uncharacterized protein LOC119727771 [Patiria miniata]
MAAYVGRKLRVSTIGGDEFEGILHSFDANSKKISLMKVSIVPSGKKLTGLLHFYGQEIRDLVEVVDEPGSKTKEKNRPQSEPKKEEDDLSDTEDDSDLNLQTSHGYIYLKRPGAKFRQAVDLIKTQQLIGVAMEAEKLGRRAKVSLLQICCVNQVFIFDVLSLGPSVFTQGLAEVLESPAVVKVMHDSRWTSDQLYHQYSVKLTNVYDTQAADVLIRMRQLNGELPHKLCSLPECLLEYLHMSMGEVYPQWMNEQARENEADSCWVKRPLPPKLLLLAAGKASHLPELRVVTLHHLLAEFTASVEVFLGCIRDLPDMNRSKANVSSSVVPRQLERLVYGHLPSTNPPVSNHSTTPIGYDPLQKETLTHPQEKKQNPVHHLSSSDTSASKTPPTEPTRITTTPSQPMTSNAENFCVPKTTTSKVASPPERLTNGFAPSTGDGVQSKRSHPRKAAGKRQCAPVFSPTSCDTETVTKVDVDKGKNVVSTEKEGNGDGFWDLQSDDPNPATNQTSEVPSSVTAAAKLPEQDAASPLLSRSEIEQESHSGRVCSGEDDNDSDGDDSGDDDSDDDSDSDDDDNDDKNSGHDKWTELNKENANTSREPLPSPSSHTETIQRLLSLSPTRKHTLPTLESTSRKVTTRNKGSTLAGSSMGKPSSSDPRSTVDSGTGRLYSSVLKDAGLLKTDNRRSDVLNVQSPTQFPELDQESQEKPKKHLCRHGWDQPSSGWEPGDSGKAPVTKTGELTQDEVPGSTKITQRNPGAVPKARSMYATYPEENADRSQSVGVDNMGSAMQLSEERPIRPSIGRGRARVLAQSEDMLRSIRRPVELQNRSFRVQQYDFPSREEMAMVPKNLPARASDYYKGAEAPDGSYP